MKNENTSAGELTDAQLFNIAGPTLYCGPGRERQQAGALAFARAIIAADRALRASAAVGDAAMPVEAWRVSFNGGLSWTIYERDPNKNNPKGTTFAEEPLVKQVDAQAALAAKDAEIAALDQSESQLIGERDDAQEYGTKLADAVSDFFRVPVGEYSNMNDPREEALSVLDGAYITDSDQDRQVATLTAERDALRKDALRAATVAFGLMANDYPNELPEDAAELSKWLGVHAFASLPDDMGPEGLFIHIIRAAMTKTVTE